MHYLNETTSLYVQQTCHIFAEFDTTNHDIGHSYRTSRLCGWNICNCPNLDHIITSFSLFHYQCRWILFYSSALQPVKLFPCPCCSVLIPLHWTKSFPPHLLVITIMLITYFNTSLFRHVVSHVNRKDYFSKLPVWLALPTSEFCVHVGTGQFQGKN